MEILSRTNWVDVLVVIIVLRISYVAFQDGLSHEIFPLIGSACTIVLALHYYHKISIFISQNVLGQHVDILNFISFLVLAVGVGFIFKFLKVVLDKIIKVTWHPLIERFGGLLAGVARASIVTATVLTVLALMPLSYLQWSIRDKSLTGVHFLRIGPSIYAAMAGLLPNLKAGGTSVDSEAVVRELVSDKSVTREGKKKTPRTAEWEEAGRL